jgi:hypothetical protein
MYLPSVPLTLEQSKKITEAIGAKAPNLKCPACGHLAFGIEQEISYVLVGPPIARVAPCVMVTCQNCGHVLLFNVFTLGVADMLGIKKVD